MTQNETTAELLDGISEIFILHSLQFKDCTGSQIVLQARNRYDGIIQQAHITSSLEFLLETGCISIAADSPVFLKKKFHIETGGSIRRTELIRMHSRLTKTGRILLRRLVSS